MRVQLYGQPAALPSLRDAAVDGLSQTPRAIAPKFFYDERGSRLFEAICDQPEYYLPRAEMEILARHMPDIADCVPSGGVIVEPGCGAGVKIRLLLQALHPCAYVPMDICCEYLQSTARTLGADYPWLQVHALWSDFSEPPPLPEPVLDLPKLIFFPGSSIGNFERAGARQLLARWRDWLAAGDYALIGVDLRKDADVLNAAYNDRNGVTAQFNLNLLHRMKRELDADVDVDGYRHAAYFNDERGCVEMHLVSRRRQAIVLDGDEYSFDPGETIHTEDSHKYGIEEFQRLAQDAGFASQAAWTDERNLFSVHLLKAAAP